MKKYLSVTIIVAVLFSLFSCSALCASPDTELLRSSFKCEIAWRTDGKDFRANITRSANDLTLSMVYPKEMSGLSMSGYDGNFSFFIDGVRSGDPPLFFLYISELFLSDSPFKFISRSSIGSASVLSYSRGEAIWYFDAESGKPLKFECGSDKFEMIWIEGL